MKDVRRKLIFSSILVILINAFGTIGYMVIEGWNFRDSLFMTVITLTTVGYGEVHDLTPKGEIFTIVLLAGGLGIILYVFATGAKVIFEGELKEVLGRRRLEKKLRELKDHYIICGFGRMGRIISRELRSYRLNFVIIEKNPLSPIEAEDYLIFEGDATSDEVLKKAGIESAKGLVSVLSTDAENMYVILSARELNPDIFLLVRASDEGAEQKMLRAGASRVVSPYLTGGLK
ncbi:MAG: potassium channel family protein, partial [Thermodesulfobacteriota bacterium]